MTNQIKLGTAVTYFSTEGFEKLAFVIATPETIKPEMGVPELQEGFLHLTVLSPNGHVSPRFSVPSEEVAKNIPDFASEGELALRGVWKTL